jgi:hypothetical protein
MGVSDEAKNVIPLKFLRKIKNIYFFCSTLSEFENFLLCEQILINVTTCQNVKLILKILSDLESLRGSSNKKTLYSTCSWAFKTLVSLAF